MKRLDLYCKYNPFMWFKGQCVPPSENLSINKRILYVATGPVASIVTTIVCWQMISKYDFSGSLKFIIAVIFFFGLLHTISSIFPREKVSYSANGNPLPNDAKTILLLIKSKRFRKNIQ